MSSLTHSIFFSPTGTTLAVVDAVRQGMGSDENRDINLTYKDTLSEISLDAGVALIGCPVYAGRVPKDFLKRIEPITGKQIPAILIALYGNREYEDALVELRDIAQKKGFTVIAAGAFIGEHSYSTAETEIAPGRPDSSDLQIAKEFGEKIAEKLKVKDYSLPEIDGNVPYKERPEFGGIAPQTDPEKCTLCNVCATLCPKQIVTVQEEVTTDEAECIMCCACVKGCEYDARQFTHPFIEEKREALAKMCSSPKTPTLFL